MSEQPHWADHAACKGQDLNKFYPNPSDADAENWALAWCEICPVRAECLLVALNTELDGSDRHGIWGGKTPQQRYAMYRKESRHNGQKSA